MVSLITKLMKPSTDRHRLEPANLYKLTLICLLSIEGFSEDIELSLKVQDLTDPELPTHATTPVYNILIIPRPTLP